MLNQRIKAAGNQPWGHGHSAVRSIGRLDADVVPAALPPAERERRGAGQKRRVEVVGLLREARSDGEAEIRGGVKFDAGIQAVAGRVAGGHRVECRKRVADAGAIVLDGVKSGIDRDRCALEIVTGLRAFIREGGAVAEADGRGEIAQAPTQIAALAADKPAILEIVARGKVAEGVIGVRIRRQRAAETGRRGPIRHRLRVRRRTEANRGRDGGKCETA
jgi:hypothetical protein